jgi:uncharacterized protein YjiS (DUF1127 family)
MMTQPIRTFQNMTSEATPAGGNTQFTMSFEDRQRLEVRARYARAELVADGLVDAILWLRRQWRRVVEAVRTDFQLRAAEAQLHRMSDRELADLGLARSDIPFAVRQAVHGVIPQIEGYTEATAAANQNWRRAA